MEELGVMNTPECIYIVDEKGCQLCLHEQPLVMVQRGRKRINLVAAEHGKNVTIMSCGNAVGSAITPLIKFKGQRMKGEWLDALTPGSIAQLTTHGSMTAEALHISYIIKLHIPAYWCFDQATSHLDHSKVEAAVRHDITLMPSNSDYP